MARPATIEDAPHYLNLLHTYGNTAVTLSLALLSVSVAFAEKLLKPPVDLVQATFLVLLWLCLLLALVCGLFITSNLTSVSSNYMKALRAAFPDPLAVLGKQGKAKVEDPSGEVQVTEEGKKEINTALDASYNRTLTAIQGSAILVMLHF